MAKAISTLPAGAIVKSLNTKYNGSVLRFKVGHQASGRTKLIAERIISIKCFDAAEPNNTDSNRKSYGNNRYIYANIDSWLNSAAASWYSAKHTYDQAPIATYTANYNPYDTEAGFLTNFEADFRNAILDTTLTVAKNTVTDGGGSETLTRKVYLLSNTEVGLANENSIAEGTKWDLFSDNNSRFAYPTAEAVSKSTYTNSGLNASATWWWYLRTPSASHSGHARVVNTDGTLGNADAYNGYGGVRPAFELASSILVSDSTDTDGAYILQWNQPPTTPSNISYGAPKAGQSIALTTGGSTDPEGDAISYVWERRVDSGSYIQLGITSAKSINDTVPTSGTNYQARVKAADSKGAESAYCTGAATAISYITDPVISGSDQNVGAKTGPFTYEYTVTETGGATPLSVTETLSNGTETITLRTFTATVNVKNTADLSDVWLRLLGGSHTLTITVNNGAGGVSKRVITFSRTVTRIAASRAIATSAPVTKCFLSLYPSDRPADAVFHCEVTNNPFDASPVWEDVTDKVNRFVHTFENAKITATNGIAYRFYITKGTQTIEAIQFTARFA